MAISRVSDLPQIENQWLKPDNARAEASGIGARLKDSLLEVSLCMDDSGGRYESKSIDIKTLQDYISEHLVQQTVFDDLVSFNAGIELTGAVVINNGVDVQTGYGLTSYGHENILEAEQSNQILSKGTIELQAVNQIEIATDADIHVYGAAGIAMETDSNFSIVANSTFIGSDLSTFLGGSSPDDKKITIGQISAESHVPFAVPTPIGQAEDSKQAVNIDYLYHYFYDSIKDKLIDKIIDELNQQEDTPDVPQTSDYPGYKLFELRTFDYQLDDDECKVNGDRILWPLGSTVPKTQAPQMYSKLASIADSGNTAIMSNYKPQITCKCDENKHYVVRRSADIDTIRNDNITKYGLFWIYVIDDTNIILPVNNMFFRSTSSDKDDQIGEFTLPAIPDVSFTKEVLIKADKMETKRQLAVHLTNRILRAVVDGEWTLANFQNAAIEYSKGNWIYSTDDYSGAVLPPAIRTYTYMVCY